MALALDQSATVVRATGASVTSGAITTTVANEIILAECSSDGFFSGPGDSFTITDNKSLSWWLVGRQNTSTGSAEVWAAQVWSIQTGLTVTITSVNGGSGNEISLKVTSLSGHDTITPFGAQLKTTKTAAAITANLTTTFNNSWVFALMSKTADNTTSTAGAGQTLLSDSLVSTTHGNGVCWRQTATTTTAGTVVTMNLSAPATGSGDIILFEILPAGANTIQMDNLTTAQSGGSTITQAHNIPAANDMLIVSVYNHQGTITSVTYNGVAMTKKVNAATAFNETAEIWYMYNPPTGSNNIVVTPSGGSWLGYTAMSFSGVKSTSQPIASNTANGSGSTASVSVTPPTTNDLIIDACCAEDALLVSGSMLGDVKLKSANSFENGSTSHLLKAVPASVTSTYAIASGQRWAMVNIVLEGTNSAVVASNHPKLINTHEVVFPKYQPMDY